ncbi:MAG: thiazole synthase [Alphaproteobacteria bacterium]|nr:thiazole synthase [Alphaproteobacteria bacterium]
MNSDPLVIAGRRFTSRLLVGTGRFKSPALLRDAVHASGAEIITVAVRRVNLSPESEAPLQEILPPQRYTYLPNSAGCHTAEEALRYLRLARELGGWDMVKLEVIGDARTLYPDAEETVKAARILVSEGFTVMAYTNDDPVTAAKLEQAGCAAIMPLGAPIGSGLGIQNPLNIRLIVEQAGVPVLVDAGVGTASDAAMAMELGCSGVLMNAALSDAADPVVMARAMKAAVEAGRLAYLAGRMPKRACAAASSPREGFIA